jgi:hypothetical protein
VRFCRPIAEGLFRVGAEFERLADNAAALSSAIEAAKHWKNGA